MSTIAKQQAYKRGLWAETYCCLYLLLRGFRIKEQRYRTHVGEIDIIAKRGKQLIFIEVKSRNTVEEGLYSVSQKQQSRITKAALYYLSRHPEYDGLEMRFDLMVVTRMGRIHCLPNAFEATA